MLKFVPCQLATPSRTLPSGDNLLFEPKYDGYRCQLWVRDGKLRLFTRGGLDWTTRLGRSLPSEVPHEHDYVLDGEICVLDKTGRPDFGLLCKALSDVSLPFSFFAFDLLASFGQDLTWLPLRARKDVLSQAVESLNIEGLNFVDHFSDGEALAARLEAARWEGLMAKDGHAPYKPGERSPAWRKFKFKQRQEFLIAGWRPDNKTGAVKSIVLATMDDGALTLRGSVGSGFSGSQRKQLAEFLSNPASLDLSAPQATIKGDIRFVSPQLVAEVEFLEFSSSGCVRGASFIGLREDKAARTCSRRRLPLTPLRKSLSPWPHSG
ncbi:MULTISPECIES: non-homologous end-joining DNA ligase [unclassified Mesorhizobium]|uniref:non-homologous end-joining DNA ligase n=2 Tax=Mesorhizobium TaxID=68287 RepID=UPI0016736D7D|nr:MULTISPECIES: non-homologous end-joining DNA ligase [unclassified Mesorhizobium]